LRDSDYISNEEINSMIDDCEEILIIIGSIQKTIKNKGGNS